jgi:hypothetical protein
MSKGTVRINDTEYDLVPVGKVEELEDKVKNGFQGGCWCCESVAAKNEEYERRNKAAMKILRYPPLTITEVRRLRELLKGQADDS